MVNRIAERPVHAQQFILGQLQIVAVQVPASDVAFHPYLRQYAILDLVRAARGGSGVPRRCPPT